MEKENTKIPRDQLEPLTNFDLNHGDRIEFDIYNSEGALIHPSHEKITSGILNKIESWEAIYLIRDQYHLHLEKERLKLFKGNFQPGDKVLFEPERVKEALTHQEKLFQSACQDVIHDHEIEYLIDFIDNQQDNLREGMTQKRTYVNVLNVLKSHDDYTFRHSVNVGLLSMSFMSAPGVIETILHLAEKHKIINKYKDLNKSDIKKVISRNVALGGFFHDIGKAKVASEILNKQGPLSKDEMEEMKRHPEEGSCLLKDNFQNYNDLFFEDVKEMVLYHHLQYNQNGYPDGSMPLKNNPLIFFSRITSIMDVFDALTSERSYKRGWTAKEALRFIWNQSAKHFDPVIAFLFLKTISRKLNRGNFFYEKNDYVWVHTRDDNKKLLNIHLAEIIEENDQELQKPKVRLLAEVKEEKNKMVLRKLPRKLEIDLSQDPYYIGERKMTKILEPQQKDRIMRELM